MRRSAPALRRPVPHLARVGIHDDRLAAPQTQLADERRRRLRPDAVDAERDDVRLTIQHAGAVHQRFAMGRVPVVPRGETHPRARGRHFTKHLHQRRRFIERRDRLAGEEVRTRSGQHRQSLAMEITQVSHREPVVAAILRPVMQRGTIRPHRRRDPQRPGMLHGRVATSFDGEFHRTPEQPVGPCRVQPCFCKAVVTRLIARRDGDIRPRLEVRPVYLPYQLGALSQKSRRPERARQIGTGSLEFRRQPTIHYPAVSPHRQVHSSIAFNRTRFSCGTTDAMS